MSLRYSFFAIVPDGIIEIPQGSNLSWLTLFYALPRELPMSEMNRIRKKHSCSWVERITACSI